MVRIKYKTWRGKSLDATSAHERAIATPGTKRSGTNHRLHPETIPSAYPRSLRCSSNRRVSSLDSPAILSLLCLRNRPISAVLALIWVSTNSLTIGRIANPHHQTRICRNGKSTNETKRPSVLQTNRRGPLEEPGLDEEPGRRWIWIRGSLPTCSKTAAYALSNAGRLLLTLGMSKLFPPS